MPSSITSLAAMGLGLLASLPSANAHIVITSPVPFDQSALNNSPLAADGSNYPCKFGAGYTSTVTSMNNIAAGGTSNVTFMGSAVHGGGSCQISITTDPEPTKDSVFKVIYSIIGGCPANTAGNIAANTPTYTGSDLNSFDFTIPKSVPNGKATMAWSWLNKIGNREFYMNCAPITVTGGASDTSEFDQLPNMMVANIAVGGQTCSTPESFDMVYPDPGTAVTSVGTGPFTTATCAGGAGGSGGSAAAPTSAAGSSPSSAAGGYGASSAVASSPAAATSAAGGAGGSAASSPAASAPAAASSAAGGAGSYGPSPVASAPAAASSAAGGAAGSAASSPAASAPAAASSAAGGAGSYGPSPVASAPTAASSAAGNPGGVFAPGAGTGASSAAGAAPTTLATSAAASPAASGAAAAPSGSSSTGACAAGWQPCTTEGVSCISSTEMINCANGCGYVTDLGSTGMSCDGSVGAVHMGYVSSAAQKRGADKAARRIPAQARRAASRAA